MKICVYMKRGLIYKTFFHYTFYTDYKLHLLTRWHQSLSNISDLLREQISFDNERTYFRDICQFFLKCTTRRFALESLCVSVGLSVCLSVCHQLAKTLIILEPHGIFWQSFAYLYRSAFIYRLTCITVFFGGRGFAEHQLKILDQLVKLLITLEPRSIFTSNFVYLCTLTLSTHCHAKRWRGFAEHHFGRSSSFSENVHNSWTP